MAYKKISGMQYDWYFYVFGGKLILDILFYTTAVPFRENPVNFFIIFFKYMGSNPVRILLDLQYMAILMKIELQWVEKNINFYLIFSPLFFILLVAGLYYIYRIIHFGCSAEMKKTGRMKKYFLKSSLFYLTFVFFCVFSSLLLSIFCRDLENPEKKDQKIGIIFLILSSFFGLLNGILVFLWHREIRLM